MRAVYYRQFGEIAVLEVGELPVPELKEGEVLVRVKAAAINPVDAGVRRGMLSSFIPVQFPAIPGWDVAGVIEERGFAARRFPVGAEVYGYARRPVVQWGSFAEYIVLPESYLALRPQQLSWEEAAGIPLVGLTAYQSLFDAGGLQAGQTVLILGASGGVGSLGIQLAKSRGAKAIGVASARNHAFMTELGAVGSIDYNSPQLAEEVKRFVPEGVDLIFDCASGDTLTNSLPALKPGGRLVSILNRGTDLDKGIDFHYVFVEPNATQLGELAQLADAGGLKVKVSATYKLEDAAEAFRQIESHHTQGKVVLVP
ncbi:zinc-binding oxidoreductase [Cnuella takakiae]|nr:zinc-binding oxidoreductase [Cnuella takakiae]